MLSALPHATVYFLALYVLLGYAWGGFWSYVPMLWVFVITPGADLFLKNQSHGLSEQDQRDNVWFSVVVWLWVPIQLCLIVLGLIHVSRPDSTWLTLMESTLALGMCCGAIGMVFGHEMIHRHSRFERLLAEILMTSMTYPQLCIEHLYGHHRHYGKWDDYATARFGESYYHAVFRGIRGSIATAWKVEVTRLKRRHLRTFDPRNRMLRYLAVLMAIYAAIGYWFGSAGIVLFAGHSAISIGLLFATNYVEHYGLSRREIAPGVYEAVGPHLSWDAPGRLTDVFTLHLQRHADHHRVMSRHYPRLEYLPDTPQLPLSYGFMMLLAFVPPLWRTIMDRRVMAWSQLVPVTRIPAR